MSVEVKLVRINKRSETGGSVGLAQAVPIAEEIVTWTSGVPVAGTITAPANVEGLAWSIKATGGARRVLFGTNPTVTTTTGWHLSDGERLFLGATQANEKVSVIGAS